MTHLKTVSIINENNRHQLEMLLELLPTVQYIEQPCDKALDVLRGAVDEQLTKRVAGESLKREMLGK
jgi:hypothetical protein